MAASGMTISRLLNCVSEGGDKHTSSFGHKLRGPASLDPIRIQSNPGTMLTSRRLRAHFVFFHRISECTSAGDQASDKSHLLTTIQIHRTTLPLACSRSLGSVAIVHLQ